MNANEKLAKVSKRLDRIGTMYDRLKKIEIRNLFQNMSKVLNTYKREHGKLIIDIKHLDKAKFPDNVSALATEPRKADTVISDKLLVAIRSAKTPNTLLGVLNYTLPPRVFSRVKRAERVIKNQQHKLLNQHVKLSKVIKSEEKPKDN